MLSVDVSKSGYDRRQVKCKIVGCSDSDFKLFLSASNLNCTLHNKLLIII